MKQTKNLIFATLIVLLAGCTSSGKGLNWGDLGEYFFGGIGENIHIAMLYGSLRTDGYYKILNESKKGEKWKDQIRVLAGKRLISFTRYEYKKSGEVDTVIRFESPYKISRLGKRYRLTFNNQNTKPVQYYAYFFDEDKNLKALWKSKFTFVED